MQTPPPPSTTPSFCSGKGIAPPFSLLIKPNNAANIFRADYFKINSHFLLFRCTEVKPITDCIFKNLQFLKFCIKNYFAILFCQIRCKGSLLFKFLNVTFKWALAFWVFFYNLWHVHYSVFKVPVFLRTFCVIPDLILKHLLLLFYVAFSF